MEAQRNARWFRNVSQRIDHEFAGKIYEVLTKLVVFLIDLALVIFVTAYTIGGERAAYVVVAYLIAVTLYLVVMRFQEGWHYSRAHQRQWAYRARAAHLNSPRSAGLGQSVGRQV